MKLYPHAIIFMSNQSTSIILFILLLAACNSPANKENIPTGDSLTVQDSNIKAVDTISKESFTDDTLYHVSFADTTAQEILGRLKRKGPSITCHFTITKPARLVAIIIPRKEDCNIRINNIMLPGNKSDGPFGRELKYDLPRKGDHRLVIGQNLMAGDAEACEFVLKLKLE